MEILCGCATLAPDESLDLRLGRNAGGLRLRARPGLAACLRRSRDAIDGWRLHRRMGMSGGLFKRAVMRELGRTISMPRLKGLDKRHGELFRQFLPKPRPLPGAVELLRFLRRNTIVHGIATSNQRPNINPSLKALGVTKDTVVVERGDVARAKPEPDLFLECSERLGVEVKDCYVVGDAVWDLMAARRAGMLSIGLLSGGYGADELIRAGAFRGRSEG